MSEQSVKEIVQEKYGEAARRVTAGNGNSGCGASACCGTDVDPITSDLYDEAQKSGLPQEAVLASLGCGNPTALAALNPGETVLDLGSGGGIDVLLSARRVGPTGKAYGLDMTDDMLALARQNQLRAGVENVEFLKGEIEHIPLPDNSVDVIISNCVINLSADKDQVLREAFRVLKPGGRFAVSDVVVRGEVPEEVRKHMLLWVGCIAGALKDYDYVAKLAKAGFDGIDIEPTRVYNIEDARTFLSTEGIDVDAIAPQVEGKFMGAFIRATKPPGRVVLLAAVPKREFMSENITAAQAGQKRLAFFERYLSVWVALCMVVGIIIGKTLPSVTAAIRGLEFGQGSNINAPIALLIWLMITPMMMKVDFSALKNVGRRPTGLIVTVLVNWVVKPFSMALLAWFFFRFVFSAFITSSEADQYIAGCIILAAAPCTAMVFVWSHLTDGDPAYTLVQVSVNDLIMLVLFVPIVQFLVSGASSLHVPFQVLLYSVIVFIVVPLLAGTLLRMWFVRSSGKEWFEKTLLPRFAPLTIAALLATLALIFAFQADNITGRFLHVLLIAVPITLQVYFNASLTYGLMRLFKVEHSIAAPGALIGASNFFELAVATAIALFGPESGAALATVVGVLVEVPVMLSVCSVCNRTRHWFPKASEVPA